MNKHKTSARVPAFATTTVLVVVIAALTIAVSGLGYMQYNNLRKENKTLKDVLVNIKDKKVGEKEEGDGGSKRNEEEENTRDVTFSKEQLENFKAALNTMNTQPFEGYMAEKVEIYYNSPNKSTELEPTRATLTLDYLEKAKKPWVFPLTEEQKKKYASKEGFAELFKPSCLTGVSADSGHLVSLCFNGKKKIERILLCNDLGIFK